MEELCSSFSDLNLHYLSPAIFDHGKLNCKNSFVEIRMSFQRIHDPADIYLAVELSVSALQAEIAEQPIGFERLPFDAP